MVYLVEISTRLFACGLRLDFLFNLIVYGLLSRDQRKTFCMWPTQDQRKTFCTWPARSAQDFLHMACARSGALLTGVLYV